MQGVGPAPTLAKAFEPIGKKEGLGISTFDPNKTSELPFNSNIPDLDKVEKDFRNSMQSQFKQFNKEKVAKISQDQQRKMEKDGWKFQKLPNGDWSAHPPMNRSPKTESSGPDLDKREKFIKSNKADFKKRYGARWQEVLYAAANEKFKSK